MKLVGGLLLPAACVLAAAEPPISNEGEKTFLAPRAVTYFSYLFPPAGSDFSTRSVPNDNPTKNHLLFPDRKPGTPIGSTANWTSFLLSDWKYQNFEEEELNQRIGRFFAANPTYRRTENPGPAVCGLKNLDADGETLQRIVQIHTDSFMPVEVPVFSCETAGGLKNGHLTAASVILLRDIVSDAGNRLELVNRTAGYTDEDISHPLAVSYQSQLLHSFYYSSLGNWPNAADILQAGGRSDKSGRLQIAPLANFLNDFDKMDTNNDEIKQKYPEYQKMMAYHILPYWGAGMTVQFGGWDDRGRKFLESDVIVNVDTLVRQPQLRQRPIFHKFFPTYAVLDAYETFDDGWNLTEASNPAANLRLDVFWEPWGCCSACCCPRKMCGVLETVTKCADLTAIKSRRGFLVLKKLLPDEPVDLTDLVRSALPPFETDARLFKRLRGHLERLFDWSPYREQGIPLYSTLIHALFRRAIVQGHFEKKFLKMRNFTGRYEGVGLFIAVEPCGATDPQKLNCSVLAKCRGVRLIEERMKGGELPPIEKDVCSEVRFFTLTMDSWKNWFKLKKGRNYRLQLEETRFGGKKLIWRIAGKLVSAYRNETNCSEQGLVVRGRSLLFTKNSKFDEELKIEVEVEGEDDRLIAILTWKKPAARKKAEEDNEMLPAYVFLFFVIGVGLVLIMLALLLVDQRILMRRKIKLQKKQSEEVENPSKDRETTAEALEI